MALSVLGNTYLDRMREHRDIDHELLARWQAVSAVARIADRARLSLGRDTINPAGAPGGALMHLQMIGSLRGKARYIWRRALQPNQLEDFLLHRAWDANAFVSD